MPCQTCIFGRAPLKPGNALNTLCAHCWPVSTKSPSAHCSFHESPGWFGSAKHPNATPESTTPARKTSGYAPARTLVIIAPEDVPAAKTRAGSTPQFASAKRAADAMPSESPPPLCVSVSVEETSQQVPECGCVARVSRRPDTDAGNNIQKMGK